MTSYEVRSGECIISIASKFGVPWESIIVANEAILKANTAKYCANKSDAYKNRHWRRGYFCNYRVFDKNGQPLVFANTLMPGDVLQIPSKTTPVAIQQAVTNVPGSRIVVVIDDTGSMHGEGDGYGRSRTR
jgi:hypothetical protein